MPSVRSTLTRRTGRTTVNWLVKWAEMSSPRDAISAISSAVAIFLDVLAIALYLLFCRFPGCHQMIKLACGVMPDFKDDGTQEAAAPTDGTKLLRIVALLVDQVRLIEDLLRLLQADPVLPLDLPAFLSIKLEARHVYITVISSNLAELASLGAFQPVSWPDAISNRS